LYHLGLFSSHCPAFPSSCLCGSLLQYPNPICLLFFLYRAVQLCLF
jgi:hypothetical protein